MHPPQIAQHRLCCQLQPLLLPPIICLQDLLLHLFPPHHPITPLLAYPPRLRLHILALDLYLPSNSPLPPNLLHLHFHLKCRSPGVLSRQAQIKRSNHLSARIIVRAPAFRGEQSNAHIPGLLMRLPLVPGFLWRSNPTFGAWSAWL